MNTINTGAEGAVLVAEIYAPPINFLGPELLRDLVSLIRLAEDAPLEDFRRDSIFSPNPCSADPQRLIGRAMERGLQTRDAEMNLARMLYRLGEGGRNQARPKVGASS
jgi:hypothetical protein